MKRLLIVGIVGLLAGCATPSAVIKDKPLKPGEHARIDTAVAAQGIEGEYVQLGRTQIRLPNGAVHDSTHLYHGRTQGGRIVEAAAAGIGAAAVNQIGAYAREQAAKPCDNCGGDVTYNVANSGSSAISQSKASLKASGGLCGPGQSCPFE